MLSIIKSCNLIGIEGFIVNVEVDITRGMPCFNVVGLASTEVKEAKERVKSSIINSDFEFPTNRIVVNLSPADIKKEGSLLDFPIAIGILRKYIKKPLEYFEESVFVGELSLNGDLKRVRGVLPIIISAKESGFKRIFIPYDNFRESHYINGIEIIPIKTLRECILYINKKINLQDYFLNENLDNLDDNKYDEDFYDIKGNYFAKRGIEIAAAGNHNTLLIGPPGSGKTMLAKRIRTILPKLDEQEMIDVSKTYSVAGLIDKNIGIISKRPFRSPHHSATTVSMIGGGAKSMPGEIALAHRGVLFLDELGEFNKKTLEMLRQPLEDNFINISRIKNYVKYPSNVLLVAAMNPCPCGYYMSDKECNCSAYDIKRYKNRISGPLLDRFDMFIEVNSIDCREFNNDKNIEDSNTIRNRVEKAKDMQKHRFKNTDIKNNNEIKSSQLNKYCGLDKESLNTINMIFNKYKLSNRSYTKLLKTARTIADLELDENIKKDYILEAFSFRKAYYTYFR